MKIFKKAALVLCAFLAGAGLANAQKIKPEEIIAKHLDSVAASDVRAATKTIVAVGSGTQRFTSTADAPVPGRIVFASEGPRTFVGINTESAQYPGERFIFDGKSASVALSSLNKRSFLGNFVQDNAVMQKSGLIGGELSTGWLMATYSPDKGKLSYEGNGKVNGKSAHVLQFTPKGGSDISIKLFFDAETYRHLRTEYRRMVSAPQGVMQQNGIGRSDINSGRQSETRIDLTEEFTDFKTENGLTLPRGYKLIYSYSGNQGTVSAEWNFVLTEFVTNQKIEPGTFVPAARQ